jgi:hypothetical protein
MAGEDERDSGGVDGDDAPEDAGDHPADAPTGAGDEPSDAADASTGAGGDFDDDAPVEVGDGRKKHVTVVTVDGDQIEHGDVYLRHSRDEFVVSDDSEFEEEDVIRYAKDDLRRFEVTQHHSTCFITTATTGPGDTLRTLRGFRDDTLRSSTTGRALVGLYEAVSPPIAATLARHPDARTTRFVRALVEVCAGLARRRDSADAPVSRVALAALLVGLYVAGVAGAALGHLAIRARERTC